MINVNVKDNVSKYVGSLTFGIIFLTLITIFHIADPYRTLFFSQSHTLNLLHIIGRLAFCAFLFEILFAFGQLPLSWLHRHRIDLCIDTGEELAISILCGSAILRIAMFLLGFAGLYEWPILAAIATMAVIFGWNRFRELCRQVISKAKITCSLRSREGYACLIILLALIIACTIVVIEKYLFPNGTGDYFSHYFPYYKSVIAAKNIWPNDVWYHFYISKGAGDVFFSIILSDLLGSAAVSCAMFFAGLIIMFSMIRRITNDELIALAATTMTASGFIWTFETDIGFSHWAEFPKQHVISAVLFFGSVWASWRQSTIPKEHWFPWACLTSLIFVGLVILRPQFAMICVMFLAIMIAWAWLSGNYLSSYAYLITTALVGLTTISMLLINYRMTGLAEVTPFRFFWQFADQTKFSEWVSPFLMLLLDLGSSPDLGSISPPDLQKFPFLKLLWAVFRVDRASPLFLLCGIPLILTSSIGFFSIITKRAPGWQRLVSDMLIFIVMLIAALIVFFSVNQIGSLYRLYMFCMFPMIALGFLPFAIARISLGNRVRIITGLLMALLVTYTIPREISKIPSTQKYLLLDFAIGKKNIADAFTSQNAVWQEALDMVAITGHDVPIWSMQVGWHFCVAPGCNLKTFFSFSMNKDWATIMFEAPDVARTALKKQGINYFAIDTTAPTFDLLPYSPLFTPEQISNKFGLVWSANGIYLLTWRSPNTPSLPPEFLNSYRKSINKALKLADFPALYQRLAKIYINWETDQKWPVHVNSNLPRPRGWQ